MKLIVLRGIPGSGKSTWVRKHCEGGDWVVCSADDFFVGTDGVYRFDASKLAQAHQACRFRFGGAIAGGAPSIVVDNTNTKLWEFQYYLDLAQNAGYDIEVVRLVVDVDVCVSRGVHGVPREAVERMADRFEDYPGEVIYDASV